jgi:hypothetical protein
MGRPKGSKNKVKTATPLPKPLKPAGGAGGAAGAGGAGAKTLLQEYRELADSLRASLAATGDAKEAAQLGQALSRAMMQIGKLTGEGEITEAMVMKSVAFQRLLLRGAKVFERFPAAAKAWAEELTEVTGG